MATMILVKCELCGKDKQTTQSEYKQKTDYNGHAKFYHKECYFLVRKSSMRNNWNNRTARLDNTN